MTGFQKLIAFYLKTRLRGSWRITEFLAKRFSELQNFPVLTEFGEIYVDLRIGSGRGLVIESAYKTGEEIVLKEFIKPGDVAYDIGAHFGFYTIAMSHFVGSNGSVFAFEPNPQVLQSLRKSFSDKKNVHIMNVAVSDTNGESSLFVPGDASMASLKDWTDKQHGPVTQVRCSTTTIETLIDSGLPFPKFIKIDIEGAELKVFKGAERLLNSNRAPIILFEVNAKAADAFNYNSDNCIRFLTQLEIPRYQIFQVLPSKIIKLTNYDIVYANLVAIPSNLIETLQ